MGLVLLYQMNTMKVPQPSFGFIHIARIVTAALPTIMVAMSIITYNVDIFVNDTLRLLQ